MKKNGCFTFTTTEPHRFFKEKLWECFFPLLDSVWFSNAAGLYPCGVLFLHGTKISYFFIQGLAISEDDFMCIFPFRFLGVLYYACTYFDVVSIYYCIILISNFSYDRTYLTNHID